MNILVERVFKKRFREPTEVQRRAFPIVESGKNTLIIAPTGSGKTEAALIPLLSRALDEKWEPISILYITPLRALNRDLLHRISWWGEQVGLRVDVRHGDTPTSRRAKQAKLPPHILITTPETFQAILPAEKMGKHLENVKAVIIDEIHEMVAEKRGYQLACGLERLVEKAGEFQRVGLSATVGSPELVARFLAGRKRSVTIVDVSMKKDYLVTAYYPRPDKKSSEEAKKLGLAPEVYARIKKMLEILEKHKQVLTFVNTRNMAEQLSFYFSLLHEKTDVHHSSLSREVRLVVEELFRKGEIKHLIATSSMELGIDVGEVDAVIQYGSPRQVTRLIQRVGRAGHRWDRPSIGYIIATDPLDFIEGAVIARLARQHKLERILQEKNPLDVLAHQIAGLLMDFGEITLKQAYTILTRAQPFETLSYEDFLEVVRQLESERFLRVRGELIIKSKDTWRYYYSNLSMIPDEEKFFVVDIVSGKNVAMLDEDFVATYLDVGVVFVVKGRPWRVVSIDGRDVNVEPSDSLLGAIPAWVGEQIPVEPEVSREVAREWNRIKHHMETIVEVAEQRDIDAIRDFFKDAPRPDEVRIEASSNFVVVHVPLGSRANNTLSRLIAFLFTKEYGIPVRALSTPYALILEFPGEINPDDVKRILLSLSPETLDILLENWIFKTNLFRWRFIHVARRFGLISRGAKLERINLRRLIQALTDSPVYKETINELLVEKLDVETVKKFLYELKEGKWKISVRRKLSTLAKRQLAQALQMPELLSPETPEKAILNLFKQRILNKRVKLLCTSCLSVHEYKIADLPDFPSCPRCGSKLLAPVRDEEKAKMLLEGKEIKRKDVSEYMSLIRAAELVKEFGKKAVITMSVPGIGSKTAARLLTTPYNEDEFWKALLDTEREYYRTRMFWK